MIRVDIDVQPSTDYRRVMRNESSSTTTWSNSYCRMPRRAFHIMSLELYVVALMLVKEPKPWLMLCMKLWQSSSLLVNRQYGVIAMKQSNQELLDITHRELSSKLSTVSNATSFSNCRVSACLDKVSFLLVFLVFSNQAVIPRHVHHIDHPRDPWCEQEPLDPL